MTKRLNAEKAYWVIFLISTLCLLMKIFMVSEISLSDESHQIATSYRFYLGDIPIVDDWSSVQLHGLVLLPFVYIFLAVTGTTTGIILYIRLIYLVLKAIILIFAVVHLKDNKYKFGVYTGLLLWYFFSPYNIDSLTYQSTPLILLMFCLIVFKDSSSLMQWLFSGVFYALSILSQPFWIISYPIILICIFISLRKNRFSLKNVILFHIGIMFIFLIFCYLLMSNTSLDKVLSNLKYVFNEQDHNMASQNVFEFIYEKVYLTFRIFLTENKVTTYVNLLYLLLIAFLKNKRQELKCGMFLCLGISQISLLFSNKVFLMNEMMIPFLWMGLENYFYVGDEDKKKYVELLGLGIIFSISTALGTNTGKLATSSSLSLIACISLFFWERDNKRKLTYSISQISVGVVVMISLILRIYITWAGNHIELSNFQHIIDEGPMKKMYANSDQYDKYYNVWNDIKSMNLKSTDVLFCGTSTPLAYLDAGVEFGTMGTSFFELNYYRLDDYFKTHPNKIPNVVYYAETVEKDKQSKFYTYLLQNYDIQINGNSLMARKQK